jgi:hypothetical protein
MLLHKRNMLVGRGVEHYTWAILFEQVGHFGRYGYVGNNAHELGVAAVGVEVQLEVVEARLVVIQHQQRARSETENLSDQL